MNAMGFRTFYDWHLRSRLSVAVVRDAESNRQFQIALCGISRCAQDLPGYDYPRAQSAFGIVGKRGVGETTLKTGVAEALYTVGYSVSEKIHRFRKPKFSGPCLSSLMSRPFVPALLRWHPPKTSVMTESRRISMFRRQ